MKAAILSTLALVAWAPEALAQGPTFNNNGNNNGTRFNPFDQAGGNNSINNRRFNPFNPQFPQGGQNRFTPAFGGQIQATIYDEIEIQGIKVPGFKTDRNTFVVCEGLDPVLNMGGRGNRNNRGPNPRVCEGGNNFECVDCHYFPSVYQGSRQNRPRTVQIAARIGAQQLSFAVQRVAIAYARGGDIVRALLQRGGFQKPGFGPGFEGGRPGQGGNIGGRPDFNVGFPGGNGVGFPGNNNNNNGIVGFPGSSAGGLGGFQSQTYVTLTTAVIVSFDNGQDRFPGYLGTEIQNGQRTQTFCVCDAAIDNTVQVNATLGAQLRTSNCVSCKDCMQHLTGSAQVRIGQPVNVSATQVSDFEFANALTQNTAAGAVDIMALIATLDPDVAAQSD